jgi:hypothetical protein
VTADPGNSTAPQRRFYYCIQDVGTPTGGGGFRLAQSHKISVV